MIDAFILREVMAGSGLMSESLKMMLKAQLETHLAVMCGNHPAEMESLEYGADYVFFQVKSLAMPAYKVSVTLKLGAAFDPLLLLGLTLHHGEYVSMLMLRAVSLLECLSRGVSGFGNAIVDELA